MTTDVDDDSQVELRRHALALRVRQEGWRIVQDQSLDEGHVVFLERVEMNQMKSISHWASVGGRKYRTDREEDPF